MGSDEEVMFIGRKIESFQKPNMTIIPQGKVSKLSGPPKDPSFNMSKNLNITENATGFVDQWFKLVDKNGTMKKKRSE